MGLWFDDLRPGRCWSSPARTVTEADVNAFADVTGDRFPLHTNEEYAQHTRFGTRVAHGLLGLSFAHGLMWSRTGDLDDSVIAFLGVRDWQFRDAIYFGDTIDVAYVVARQRLSATHDDRGIVEFEVAVTNQHGTVVQQGVKTLLIARRPRLRRP